MQFPRFFASFAISVLVLVPVAARAEGTAAEALFQDGRRLMDEGKYAEACPKLAESQRMDPAAGTLVNLGHCYEGAGKTASAWMAFKEAIPAARRSGRAEWEALGRERAAALEPRLVRLTIEVGARSEVPGLAVTRDAAPIARAEWGTPIPVDPGEHTITVAAPGKEPWSSTVTLTAEGQTVTTTVPPLRDIVTSPSPSAVAPARPSASMPWRAVGIGVGALGGVALVTGGVLFARAATLKNEGTERCIGNVCPQDDIRKVDDARVLASAATVAFVIGGVAVAGAVGIFLFAPTGRAPVRAPVQAIVAPLPGGIAFAFSGTL